MTRTKAEQAAIHRDGPKCLRCGRLLFGVPSSVHHRLPRSRGTKAQIDRVENCVVVCGSGSSPHCHQWIHNHPTEAVATGWTIPAGPDLPSEIPLVDLRGSSFFLTEEGDIVPAMPAGFYPTNPSDHLSPF